MDSKTRCLWLSNHFYLISAIEHKIIKSPWKWYYRHVNIPQNNQTGPIDIWTTINVECDTEAKQKWKEDRESGFINIRSHNIQDENWRLLTNVPNSLDGKINTALGEKVSTNLKDSVDNNTSKKTLLDRCHKTDTLHERSHYRVDWNVIKTATKQSSSRQLRWAVRLSAKELPTVKLMKTRGCWPIPSCPRSFGHSTKDVIKIFSVRKEMKFVKLSKKSLVTGENETKLLPT